MAEYIYQKNKIQTVNVVENFSDCQSSEYTQFGTIRLIITDMVSFFLKQKNLIPGRLITQL